MTDRQIILVWKVGMYSNFAAFCIYASLFVMTKWTGDGLAALLFATTTYLCAHQVSKYFYGD